MPKEKSKTVKILQIGDPILEQISAEVDPKDIGSAKIKSIIKDMQIAVRSQADGIAISAPQIGQLVKIVLISNKVYEVLGEDAEKAILKKDIVFINPKITKYSKEKAWIEEGCLSVRNIFGRVQRHKKVSMEALDESGKKISRGFSGILAQIVQHENDHLDGILFVSKAKDLQEVLPQEEDAQTL
jgi:peptide deformylase